MKRDSDWSRLDDPEVLRSIRQHAGSISHKFNGVVSAADLEQEGREIVATKPEFEGVSIGHLSNQVRMDMITICRRAALRESRNRPLISETGDENTEAQGEGYVPLMPTAGGYTREAITLLLPAVWDESYAYGLPAADNQPDPDMPRGTTNKAKSNNTPVFIADIKTGWKRTNLSIRERRSILCYFGLGWDSVEIAALEGVSKQAISERINTAVNKIANELNGTEADLD